MKTLNLTDQRLYHQQIAVSKFTKPGELVKWLGAVQAQDYLGALWAIGLRLKNSNVEADIERAITNKTIVRTWPMRGTLHFVAQEDVRWMLKLLTPRVLTRAASIYKASELDTKTFLKSAKLLEKALQGGVQLTRKEMYEVLERGKVSAEGLRGLHIMGYVAQQGLICFGPRKGKQPTFTLLDEWIPSARTFNRGEALAELALRYFTGHGPATVQDLAWWSGLTLADVQKGLESVKSKLMSEVINDQTYWFAESAPKTNNKAAFLLPTYDEYIVGYKDRAALLNDRHKDMSRGNVVFNPTIIIDGQVQGTWKRTLNKKEVLIEFNLFTPAPAKVKAVKEAAKRYGEFLKMEVVLTSP